MTDWQIAGLGFAVVTIVAMLHVISRQLERIIKLLERRDAQR